MKKTMTSAAFATLALLGAGSAQAYATFFGEDGNNSGTVPLTLIPNSGGAEALFKSNLVGVGTETFEGIGTGSTVPLAISFPGSSGGLTATLSGGGGAVAAVAPGSTNGAGRYSIPSGSSSKFFEVNAGTDFVATFSTAIAAFGFYGVDIGDFGGQLQLEFYNGLTLLSTQTVSNTVGSGGNTDGSVLYFGAIASNPGELFTSIKFRSTAGQGDIFAFDNFTIGDQQQVQPAPEPAALALVGVALLALKLTRRKA